jgi:hypothetical protein
MIAAIAGGVNARQHWQVFEEYATAGSAHDAVTVDKMYLAAFCGCTVTT